MSNEEPGPIQANRMVRRESCATCYYFENSICHRHAPILVTNPRYQWPIVKPTDWCGEYREKYEERGHNATST